TVGNDLFGKYVRERLVDSAGEEMSGEVPGRHGRREARIEDRTGRRADLDRVVRAVVAPSARVEQDLERIEGVRLGVAHRGVGRIADLAGTPAVVDGKLAVSDRDGAFNV